MVRFPHSLIHYVSLNNNYEYKLRLGELSYSRNFFIKNLLRAILETIVVYCDIHTPSIIIIIFSILGKHC